MLDIALPVVSCRPLLLSIGRLVALKDHNLVIEALNAVRLTYRAARLVIVGDGPARGALQTFVIRSMLAAPRDRKTVRQYVGSARPILEFGRRY